jgi:hypothetical protein
MKGGKDKALNLAPQLGPTTSGHFSKHLADLGELINDYPIGKTLEIERDHDTSEMHKPKSSTE